MRPVNDDTSKKVVIIPHDLIEKLVLCVVDAVEGIDWDKAFEAYRESNKSEYDALKAENRRLTGELEQVYERLNNLTEKIKNTTEKHNIKATNVENLREIDIN